MNPTVLQPIVQSPVEFLDTTRETLQEIAVGQNEIRQAVLGTKHATEQN